jgi:hypothetical protein
MSSRTLAAIANHLTQPLNQSGGMVQFPFNVEAFCQENDALIHALEKEVEMRTNAHHRLSVENAELDKEGEAFAAMANAAERLVETVRWCIEKDEPVSGYIREVYEKWKSMNTGA